LIADTCLLLGSGGIHTRVSFVAVCCFFFDSSTFFQREAILETGSCFLGCGEGAELRLELECHLPPPSPPPPPPPAADLRLWLLTETLTPPPTTVLLGRLAARPRPATLLLLLPPPPPNHKQTYLLIKI
jgi:hypothetical protein